MTQLLAKCEKFNDLSSKRIFRFFCSFIIMYLCAIIWSFILNCVYELNMNFRMKIFQLNNNWSWTAYSLLLSYLRIRTYMSVFISDAIISAFFSFSGVWIIFQLHSFIGRNREKWKDPHVMEFYSQTIYFI